MKFTDLINEPREMTLQMLWLALAKGLALVISLSFPLVMVRVLSQAQFGDYKQAFQVIATAVAMLGLQVNTSVYYFMPREPKRQMQVALNVRIFFALMGLLVFVGFALYPGWVTHVFKSDDLVATTPLLGLTILFWLMAEGIEHTLIVNGDIRLVSILTVVFQISKTLLLVGAALFMGSVHAMVIAAVVHGVVQNIVLASYLRYRYGKWWAPFDRRLFKAQVANSLPFGLGGLAHVAQNDLHNYLVSFYSDPATFAIYAIGCFQLPLLSILFESVESIMIPELGRLESQRNYPAIIKLWMNGMRKLALWFVPICLLLFVVRQEFIVTLFTANYLAAVPIFAVQVLGWLLFIAIYPPLLRVFNDLKFFRLRLYIVLFPLTWLLVSAGMRWRGILGASVAMVVIHGIDAATSIFVIARRLEVKRADLHYLRPIGLTFVAGLIAASAAWLCRSLGTALPPLGVLMICGIVFGLVYLAILLFTDAVDEEEKTLLRKLFFRSGVVGLSHREVTQTSE